MHVWSSYRPKIACKQFCFHEFAKVGYIRESSTHSNQSSWSLKRSEKVKHKKMNWSQQFEAFLVTPTRSSQHFDDRHFQYRATEPSLAEHVELQEKINLCSTLIRRKNQSMGQPRTLSHLVNDNKSQLVQPFLFDQTVDYWMRFLDCCNVNGFSLRSLRRRKFPAITRIFFN